MPRRPKFRITCCLCSKPVPYASDVFSLDEEWQRRFPKMKGTLACHRCATKTQWTCEKPGGGWVDGHMPSASQPPDKDFDSWSHIGDPGTHVAMVVEYPWSGLLQGAEDYLRWRTQDPSTRLDVKRRIQAVVNEWDARADSTSSAVESMTRPKRLCERHEQGYSEYYDNGLRLGGYHAVVAVDELPQSLRRDDHIIERGYAVGFGEWFFFTALEPAIAFGRAARMSFECHGYGVYEAARDLSYCELHHRDEQVLLFLHDDLGREDDEVDILKRFVQGVKEHPWSSHWRGTTGYISDYNGGRPIKTSRKSLPL